MQEKRQNIASIKSRILEYLDAQNIKKSAFLEKSGISASNFKASGLRSEIGGDKIANILSAYPDVNADWLLTGKGEMLLNEEGKAVVSVGNCIECEKLKEKIDLLEQIIEAKNETIKALQNKDSNESSKRQCSA